MEFDKETMKSLMIDHIDGKITGELAKYVELHIEKNPDAKAEYNELKEVMSLIEHDQELDVPLGSKDKILELMQDEMEKSHSKNPRVRSFNSSTFLKVAAAIAFVVAGFLGGKWLNQNSNKELLALQHELQQTKELVLKSMLKQESASQRLQGIMTSYEFEDADEDIIDALVQAMNSDSNINVRIAAVEALSRFSSNEKARASLIASLNNQEFAAVQIKLIQILVSMGDKNALAPMREFTEKEDVIKSVQDEAYMGIFKLM